MSNFKVRLRGPNGEVVFEASAPLSESRTAEYDGYNIIHLPSALISYRKTSSRQFELSGKFVSRTADEATANANNLDLIRTWVLPDFGSTGATPPILTLYGYKNKNIDGRRVVLKSYNWNFVDDVDYIYDGAQAMPVIGLIQLSLEEVYSAEEIRSGAWKIEHESGGSFVQGAAGEGNSFMLNFGWGRTDPLRTELPSAGSMTSVMSALEGSKPTIPGVIAGTLARTIGEKVLNSSAVKEVTSQLPPVLKNIFVGGANIAIKEAGKAVTNTVSSSTIQPAQGFSRQPELPATGPVGSTLAGPFGV